MPAAAFAAAAFAAALADDAFACACSRIVPLAQQAGQNLLPVFGWSLVLIALLIGGFYAISKLRQWLKEDDDLASGPAIGFTLSDLRQLHKQGKMTDEEFERARALIVGNAKAMAAKLPDPLARDRKPPGE